MLVKNKGNLLPLDKSKKLKVVLIGGDASEPYVSGQGSGGVPTSNMLVSPLAAFKVRRRVSTVPALCQHCVSTESALCQHYASTVP